jgi:hypothetical protein
MRFPALAILLLGLPRLAHADAPPTGSRFPLTARVLLAEETKAACYLREATIPCPPSLGSMMRDALEEVARRMFLSEEKGEEPDLLLEMAPRSAGIEGSYAVVTETVRIRSPSGGEIDTLSVRGDAVAFEADPQSLPAAFARSARSAAENFERDFTNSEPVVRWLLARQVSLAGSDSLGPARADLALFLDGGGEVVSVPDGLGPGFRAGLGVAGKWFLIRGTFAHWTSDLSSGGLSVTEWGLEAGPAWRPTRSWELRGGLGVQFASGLASSQDFSATMPSLFAGVQYAFWPGWSGQKRIRFALEFHTHFDSEVKFPSLAVVDVAGPSVGLFVGIEVPLIPSREQPGAK